MTWDKPRASSAAATKSVSLVPAILPAEKRRQRAVQITLGVRIAPAPNREWHAIRNLDQQVPFP
jgi:hypothetical protein